MKLPALELPDHPSDRAEWLERQLVGLELRELVTSLSGIQEQAPNDVSLEQLLGEELETLLHQGLAPIDSDAVGKLLAHPRSLLKLQERIFVNGGEYWDGVERTAHHEGQTRAQWEFLKAEIAQQEADSTEAPRLASAPTSRMRRIEYVLSGIAAVLLVGIISWMNRPPAPTGWGFNRPGALAQDIPADEYLNHLADAAHEWFNKRPETEDALALRLTQFIDGCQTLIDAPHPQLADHDRDWLRERCGVWKTNLESQLAELQSGTKTVEETRKIADETIRKLTTALRTRAAAVSA